MSARIPPTDRFWSRVAKGSDCWQWVGARNRKGYGMLTVRENGTRRTVQAHRFSWEIHRGTVPAGLMVLHHCDNPGCVNPAHLWTGTNSDNQLDSSRKGRHREARKTHCPRGHAYAEHAYNVNGRRECRACWPIENAKARERRRTRTESEATR